MYNNEAVLRIVGLRLCWNWKTGKLEVLVSGRAYGFDSRQPHQKERHDREVVSFFSASLDRYAVLPFVLFETRIPPKGGILL